MFYKWFKGVHYAEDGKELYRKLAVKYHPDNGGSGEELKEITAEFRQWWSEYKNVRKGEKTESETGRSWKHGEKKYRSCEENIDDFIDIINKIVGLENITIEICGTWLWLSGNTYPVKDYLKSIGFQWSKGKKKWYYTNDINYDPSLKKRHYIHPGMDDIRFMYGSTIIEKEERKQLDKEKVH